MNDIKVIIFQEGNNYGCEIKRGRKRLDYNSLTEDEKYYIQDSLMSFANLFSRTFQNEQNRRD